MTEDRLLDLSRRVIMFKGPKAPFSVPQRLWDEFMEEVINMGRLGTSEPKSL